LDFTHAKASTFHCVAKSAFARSVANEERSHAFSPRIIPIHGEHPPVDLGEGLEI
jgi:hypothetical protein